jgi:uncharacterized protein (DUF58 family)
MGEPLGHIEGLETLDARQFTIALRRLANGLTYGIDRSPFVGSGLEFAQSRPYEPGDPIRQMDWRVTARTGKPFVKEYETTKSMPCYLLIDTSASMTVTSGGRSKYQLALYVAGGIALACLDRVSPVGVIGVGERALRVQPSLSRDRVLQWLHQLRTYRFDERTQLARRLSELGPSLRQRSLVIILSDLHEPHCIPAIKRLAQEHEVVVLLFQDPAEERLKGAGFFRAAEAETGREFLTHGRRRWTDAEAFERELVRLGIDRLRIRTDRPFEPALRNLFRARGHLGRGSR